ncbi:M48 family metalloprotease [Novosphingobium sp. P6W]|uniref:M48 family metalloprotease n=1 Tax=Novosphingobium sp. P6W TaxID=1609758 RepID=UPI0005C2D349|nr:M48 family metalloprotease [Novosphingobium sp. P6W]AXB76347.1 LysM peptidoglycan-binding domain-containing protein [Novosphingobium sp. P6W]KIS32150.1 peptidase M48 Ste24p [Novosphingobium sp. P6W]
MAIELKRASKTLLRGGARLRGATALGAVGLLVTLAGPAPLDAQAAKAAKVYAISPSDKAQGAKAHPELLAEFGGAVTGAQASYVEQVGKKIALQSGLSNTAGDFTVTLLNSPVNNAFAIPGGYVYVTRQLTALMNNEAELAGVLGHEVGHVAARHSAQRQKAAQRNQIIGLLGSVLAGAVLGDNAFGQLGQKVFSQGSQLLTLKFSRSQELQADQLGITYLKRAGYDPRSMATVLESLARQNALEAQLRGGTSETPEWASTHPDPASRVRTAMTYAGNSATGATNRDAFLSRIDGLVYGDDPKQGVVDGRKFTHPVLRFAFDAPDGFFMVNGTSSVSISGTSGKAQFSGGKLSGTLDSYIGTVFAGLTESNQARITPTAIEKTTVNGIPAAYGTARVQSSSGTVDVVVFAYDFGNGQAYHFVALAQQGGAEVFTPMFRSLRRVSAADAGSVKPRLLDVVTVKAGDTVQSLAAKMAYSDARVDRFLVLNGLQANSALTPGQKVKLVTY